MVVEKEAEEVHLEVEVALAAQAKSIPMLS